MAKADHTSPPAMTERRLKIAADYYPANNRQNGYARSKPVPWIRLKGLWLQQAGFEINEKIRIRVMKGCLVITAE